MNLKRELEILKILHDYPSLSLTAIHQKVQEKATLRKRLLGDGFWFELLGPSVGATIVALWELEERGEIVSEWGTAPPELYRNKHRPRFYKLK
jgi:hypothetical protein